MVKPHTFPKIAHTYQLDTVECQPKKILQQYCIKLQQYLINKKPLTRLNALADNILWTDQINEVTNGLNRIIYTVLYGQILNMLLTHAYK